MLSMARAFAFLLVACLALQSIWDAEAAVKRRVRKELRKLTKKELSLYKKGLRIMYHVPTAQGQKLYGPMYKDWEYYLLKHGAAAYDSRGDQAHFSPALMTFHRAYILEFEESLLSVVPELKALPYWDVSLDGPTGPYWGKSKVITDDQYMGPLDGDPKFNWAVTKGFSGWQPIKTLFPTIMQPNVPDFNATAAYVYARTKAPKNLYRGGTTNANPNPTLTRFPAYELRPNGKVYPYFKATRLPGSNIADVFQEVFVGSVEEKKTHGFNFSTKDFNACLDEKANPGWTNWTLCVDFSTIAGFFPAVTPLKRFDGVIFTKPQILHTIWHTIIGSFSPDVQGYCNNTCLQGDAGDGGFSPNEVFTFFMHHSNMDRSAMHWQINAAKANPAMANNDTVWKYPVSQADWPTGWGGIYRDDVISSNFPFYSFGKGSPNITTGWTHKDILAWTNPLGDTLPYTYDSLVSN